MDDDRTNPVQRDEREGQRARQHGDVDEARQPRQAEVREREQQKVRDHQQQRPAEVAAAPQVDEAEGQQVVRGEGDRRVARVLDVCCWCVGLRVQRRQVRDLQRVQHDPVDGGERRGQREGRVVPRVLAPDRVAVVAAFVRVRERVVHRRYHQQQVRQRRGRAVGHDCPLVVLGARLE